MQMTIIINNTSVKTEENNANSAAKKLVGYLLAGHSKNTASEKGIFILR